MLAPVKRIEAQKDLNKKRELLELLLDKLQDLQKVGQSTPRQFLELPLTMMRRWLWTTTIVPKARTYWPR